ncbi:hypothetical protein [Rhizobium ruizarguesonis]|uniref:hypothetical protein n=1 Tax=Rhizobium ruizarguesonis TaxID=2081791 RepID=UPI001445E730|nr:hypothetical protein [Rhizobium ruizarguesonis]NKQ85520.1 hypothetical protein [Rhizobium ruizarguesonis]
MANAFGQAAQDPGDEGGAEQNAGQAAPANGAAEVGQQQVQQPNQVAGNGNGAPVEPAAVQVDTAPEEEVVTPVPAARLLPASPELRRAAEDVRVLYSYVSREGRLNPKDLLHEPLTLYAELPDRILDENIPASYEQRSKLWEILSELSNLAYPATADSIRNSYYSELMDTPDRKGRKANGNVIRPIWMIGVLGFILTLLLGLYVSFTESVVNDTSKRIEEYDKIRVGIYSGTRLENLVSTPKGEVPPPAPAPSPVGSALTSTANGTNSDDPKANATPADTSGEFATLRTQALEEVDGEIIGSFRILHITSFGFSAPLGEPFLQTPEQEYSLFSRMPLHVQGYINKTISAFILPAIASLLGAVVFILRDAERRMDSVSLSPMRSETYTPRIILAVIAGTVIGWLTGQDSSGVIAKISPAAASFVVGYCTEILFRLLDSVKEALGVNEGEPKTRDRGLVK